MSAVKCHNCEKNAIYWVGQTRKSAVPLCLDCYIRLRNVTERELESHERAINFLTSHMESVVGLPGILPRYPEPRRVIHTGAMTLNNIHVSNSQIGVLNTGTLQNVDATVTVLKAEGNAQLASAVTALAQAVIVSAELANETKNQALELLGALAAEAVAPKEKRKTSVIRAMISELSSILGGVAALNALWDKAKALAETLLN